MNPEAPTFAPASTAAGGATHPSSGPSSECVFASLSGPEASSKLPTDTLNRLLTADPTTAALPNG
jgi:hypothetical protein